MNIVPMRSPVATLAVAVLFAACASSEAANVTAGADPPAPDAGPTSDAQADDASPPPAPPLPRLVVAAHGGLSIWNGVLTADRSPDTTLTQGGLNAGATALQVDGDRLLAARDVSGGNVAILAFDAARTVDKTTAPAAVIPRVARPIERLLVDRSDRLWVSDGQNYALFENAKTLGNDATPRAELVAAAFGNVTRPGFALEPLSNNLYFGAVDPAGGVWIWPESGYLEGGGSRSLVALHDGGYGALVLEQDRLYAVGKHGGVHQPDQSTSLDGTAGVAIWDAVSFIDKATDPTVTLRTGYTSASLLVDCVVRNDVLVVASQGDDTVMVYERASQISADRAPDFVLANPAMKAPARVVLGADSRLYVMTGSGVVVFADVATTPTFVAAITTGLEAPKDLTLVE